LVVAVWTATTGALTGGRLPGTKDGDWAGAPYVLCAMFKANKREFPAGIPKKMTGTRLRAAIDCEGFVKTALIQAGINGIAAQNPRICPANMLEANKRRARRRAGRGRDERPFALLRPFGPAPAGRRTVALEFVAREPNIAM